MLIEFISIKNSSEFCFPVFSGAFFATLNSDILFFFLRDLIYLRESMLEEGQKGREGKRKRQPEAESTLSRAPTWDLELDT